MKKRNAENLPSDLHRSIGIVVRELRKQRGLRQSDLAVTVGITQAAISLLESGQKRLSGQNRGCMNLNTLQQIAVELGQKKLSKLIALAEDVPPLERAMKEAQQFVDKWNK